jgi:ketosteroid isomerase-like protein
MDLNAMKDLVVRYYHVYSTGNLNEFRDICIDPEKEIEMYSDYAQALGDMSMRATNLVAEGNQVITQWEGKGTHISTFLGKDATYKTIRMSGFDIFEFEEGKIVNHEVYTDWVKVARQLDLERFNELPLYE